MAIINNQLKNFDTSYEGASISMEKSADILNFTNVGQIINYTYTVTNNSSKSFGSLNVQDDKVTVSCPKVQNFKANQTVICTGTYTVTEQDFSQGEVRNNASAEATQTTTFSCRVQNLCAKDYLITEDASYTARASTSLTVSLNAQPALSLSKSADPMFRSGGRTITYTFTLTNIGNVALTPPFTIIDNRLRGNWSCEERTELLPGATMLCQGNYFIDAGIHWTFVNTAVATAYYNSQQVTSNAASAEVLYRQPFLPPPPPPNPYCGDGVVNQDWEQCDPPDGTTCDSDCLNMIP